MAANACTLEERQKLVELLPQSAPFRFLDEVLELSDSHIVATYRFRENEYFYRGHFPGDPVTPGVILIETMAQAALVALGLYISRKERPDSKLRTLFSECAIEFFAVVPPGARVFVHGEKVYWRRNKLQSRVELRLEDNTVAAAGTVAGLGVEVA